MNTNEFHNNEVPLESSAIDRRCEALRGCGNEVSPINDAALHEYFLTNSSGAISQPTHHLYPVEIEGQQVCAGFPMLTQHIEKQLEDGQFEGPYAFVGLSYAVAYKRLSRFARWHDRFGAPDIETSVRQYRYGNDETKPDNNTLL